LLDMNCMRMLSALSWTIADGWSPPALSWSDMCASVAACWSSALPQAPASASNQLPASASPTGRRALPPMPASAERVSASTPSIEAFGLLLLIVFMLLLLSRVPVAPAASMPSALGRGLRCSGLFRLRGHRRGHRGGFGWTGAGRIGQARHLDRAGAVERAGTGLGIDEHRRAVDRVQQATAGQFGAGEVA